MTQQAMRNTGRQGARFLRQLFIVAILATACPLAYVAWHFGGVVVLGGALLASRRLRRWQGSRYAHGTARASTCADLMQAGMLSGDDDGQSIVLGRAGYCARMPFWVALSYLFTARPEQDELAVSSFITAWKSGGRNNELIRLKKFVHLLTVAPAGAGKTVSVLAPNLLSYLGSCVVVDPKGELFFISAAWRKKQGHKIVLIDPFNVTRTGQGLCFNPMALIDPNAIDFIDQCRDLANMLIIRTGKELQPYFDDMAEAVLTAIIAFVITQAGTVEERNLQVVRDIVASPDKFAKTLDAMREIPSLARQSNMLRWPKDKELGSIMSTLQRHTTWLDSPAIAGHTCKNDFDPMELRAWPCTVYLCIPPHRMAATGAPLLRMWLGSFIRRCTQGVPTEKNPVLFLVDEAGHLGGHLQSLEDAITAMRGYGIRIWLFLQSLGQLHKCFGESAKTILDNTDTQLWFGINSQESAEEISKRVGDYGVLVESLQDSTSRSRSEANVGQSGGQLTTGRSVTTSEHGRRLYQASEVIRLPSDMGLLFHKNMQVIPVQLPRYYADAEFRADGSRDRSTELNQQTAKAVLGMLSVAAFSCLVAFALCAGPAPRRTAQPTADFTARGPAQAHGKSTRPAKGITGTRASQGHPRISSRHKAVVAPPVVPSARRRPASRPATEPGRAGSYIEFK
jgi:type IV secretion system protein VirD4